MNAVRQRVLFSAWPRFDDKEVHFWRSLRDELHHQNLALVLATSTSAPKDLDVEHVPLTTTIDAFWPVTRGWPGGLPVESLGLDPEALLRRESA